MKMNKAIKRESRETLPSMKLFVILQPIILAFQILLKNPNHRDLDFWNFTVGIFQGVKFLIPGISGHKIISSQNQVYLRA